MHLAGGGSVACRSAVRFNGGVLSPLSRIDPLLNFISYILAVLFEVRVLVELGVDPKRVARKRTRERNDTSNVRMGNNVRYDLLGWPSFLP